MKLWLRLSLLMTVVAIVPLIIAGYFSTEIAMKKSDSQSEQVLSQDAQMVATLVNTWLVDNAAALEGWMQPYPLDEMSAAQREGFVQALFIAHPTVRTIGLIDEGNNWLTPVYHFDSAQKQEDSLLEPSAEEAVSLAMVMKDLRSKQGGAASIMGFPRVDAVQGTTVLPMLVPNPMGAGPSLAVELDLSSLFQAMSGLEESGEVVGILDSKGHEIRGGSVSAVPYAKLSGLVGQDATFNFSEESGVISKGATSLIPVAGWTAVVIQPENTKTSASAEIRTRTIEILMVAALLALVTGAVVGFSLARPVRRLAVSAAQVASGQYQSRQDVTRGDEFGDLERAFNTMARQLSTQLSEIKEKNQRIRDFNRDLQKKVERRTAALQRAQSRLIETGQLAAVAEVGASLSHELNNPLAGILGLIQVLRAEGNISDSKLLRIEEMASRCRNVVATMHQFAAGESLDPSLLQKVDAQDLLESSMSDKSFMSGKVTFDMVRSGSPVIIKTDPQLATKILIHVFEAIQNGLKVGARVEVKPGAADGEAGFQFRSSSVIAEDTGKDELMAGSIGLWIARQLLSQLGGRLVAEFGVSEWELWFPGEVE